MKRDLDAALTGQAAKEFKKQMLEHFEALEKRLEKKKVKSFEGVVFVNGQPRSIGDND